MLAGRLCLQWGIEDVLDWHNSTSKEVLDFWEAFDRVEPIGEHWRQTAEVINAIREMIGFELARAGIDPPAHTADDFMPVRYSRTEKPKPKEKKQSIEEMQQIGKKLAGL